MGLRWGEVLGDEFGEAVLALKELLFPRLRYIRKITFFFLFIYFVYSQSVFSAIKTCQCTLTK